VDNNLTHICLYINGKKYSSFVSNGLTLLEFLREEIGFKGTKKGCDGGHCGACTVLLEGNAINSCMILAVQADGKHITTIEGLSDGKKIHPIQGAFIEENAIQCGFCTPGMIMSAKGLLDKNPNPTDFEIREALSGNLCRCTGYTKIVNAVKSAAIKLNKTNGDLTKEEE
jgi:carbon-monoxide dehydrogenase small subunit